MTKVYLVIEDWALDGLECGVEVETYATKELAEQRLAAMAAQIRTSKQFDTVDEVEGEYIDAYLGGYYNNDHDHVYFG